MNATKTVLSLALMTMVSVSVANTVFTWKGKGGQRVYSDTPQNLRTHNVSTMNVRSHTVTSADANNAAAAAGGQITTTPAADGKDPSLLDQQAALNAKIAEQNKKQEEANKKVEEQNKQVEAENCNRAKINLNNVQTSNRVSNREQLSAGYQKDIERYCK